MKSHSVWLTGVRHRVPTEYFVLANLRERGAVIGRLADHPIADTVVDASGLRYHFVGVAPRDPSGRFDVEALRTGEWIVQPGLVYALEEKARSPRSKSPRLIRGR
ncbi:hypothetical protein [Mesorhizobium sp.]|uniref:hypothetical protein n=1 Tax=Mesorhizobium sp. TaxID=1871066 RepID=UPI003BABFE6A